MHANDRKSILADFLGTKCVCGRPKAARQSHCRRCYFALPMPMRAALYRRFGEGYEAAFMASVQFLRGEQSPESDSFKFS